MKPLHILVIGTGMYSCGTGTDTFGTIIPAIFEWKRKNSEGEIYIAGTSPVWIVQSPFYMMFGMWRKDGSRLKTLNTRGPLLNNP